MSNYVFAINGMGSYEAGTGMREDMHMQPFNIFNYQAGVVLSTDLLVTETSPASMAVKVAAGRCFVPNSSYTVNTPNSTKYWGVLVEETTVSVDTNTSGSTRVDLVTVNVDKVTAPNAYATNVSSIVVVKGTPGSGAPALPNNSLLIGTLTIPTATTTTITTAMIADNRVLFGITETKNAAGNIEYRQGAAASSPFRVLVPTTGSVTDALTNTSYTSYYEVILKQGTHTLSTTPTLNTFCQAIIGLGSPTIGGAELQSTSGGLYILNATNLGMRISNIFFDVSSSTPSTGLNIANNYIFVDNIFGSVDGKTLLKGTGSNCQINIMAISLLAGAKIFDWAGSNSIINANTNVSTGTTWAISGGRNIVNVVTDVAGTDSGTGNNVTEVVF